VEETLGDIVVKKLKRKLADNRFSGRFYMFQFTNKYEKGLSKEMITLIEKINTNEPLRIYGHKYDSSKLPRQ
jgi:hypothetical protein